MFGYVKRVSGSRRLAAWSPQSLNRDTCIPIINSNHNGGRLHRSGTVLPRDNTVVLHKGITAVLPRGISTGLLKDSTALIHSRGSIHLTEDAHARGISYNHSLFTYLRNAPHIEFVFKPYDLAVF